MGVCGGGGVLGGEEGGRSEGDEFEDNVLGCLTDYEAFGGVGGVEVEVRDYDDEEVEVAHYESEVGLLG